MLEQQQAATLADVRVARVLGVVGVFVAELACCC